MKIKAISFDIGHTLVRYNNPLNWKSLYKPAIYNVLEKCSIELSDKHIQNAVDILSKYNTRENPREEEINSDYIFKEILNAWNQPYEKLDSAKESFYSFFQADATYYDDVVETLQHLYSSEIKLSVLTDVAYGMDNSYSLNDIASIKKYFDIVLTSVDVGFRKPNKAGFMILLQAFGIFPSEMIYVGDEEKDIIGANNQGIISVLINRKYDNPDWGQKFTIHSLSDIIKLI